MADKAYLGDKIRQLIENCFQRLKAFSRVATRYEKMAVNYAGFVSRRVY